MYRNRPCDTRIVQHKQIGVGSQNKRMGSIFIKPTVAYFSVMEQPFDDKENVFHFTADVRVFQ
jgi:hypothetical protein